MVLRFIPLTGLALASLVQAQEPVKVPAQAPTKAPGSPTVKKAPTGVGLVPAKSGWLGFRTDPNDSELILEVAPDSPAEHAGMRPGDRIVASGQPNDPGRGRDTSRAGTTAFRSAARPIVGRTYHMTLQRGDETFAVSMVAVAPPDGQVGDLSPTRVATRQPDTLRAKIDAYRTELARTTLQPSRKPSMSPSAKEYFEAGGDNKARLREAYEATRARGEKPQGADSRTYASLEENLESLNRSLRLFATRDNAVSGAEFEHLNPALGQYFGGVSEGVFVLRVSAESPAAIAGLEPGDIVERVNGERVTTIASLREHVANATGTITLDVIRKGRPATITLRKEE